MTWGANVEAFSPERRERRAAARRWGSRRARWPCCSAAASGPGTACTCWRRRRGGCARRERPLLRARGRAAGAGRATATAAAAWARVPYERDARGRRRRRHRRRPLRHARGCAQLAARASTGRRSRSSSTWPRACPRSPSRAPRSTEIVRDGQEGLHVARGAIPRALAAAIERLAGDAALRRAAGRERARARGRALLVGAPLRAARGACCGGSPREDRPGQRGLPAARGRRGLVHARAGPRPARGRPRGHGRDHEPGPGGSRRPARPRGSRARGRKRLAVPRAFARALAARGRGRRPRPALAVRAGRPGRRPTPARVAVTVRDHWPVCFWSTRISRGALCPALRRSRP